MKKFIKENWTKVLYFILGIIVTIAITKLSDKVFPSNPTIVKEVTDTITIVHNYKEDKDKIEPNIINQKVDINVKKRTIDFKESNSLENIEIPKYNLNLELNKPIRLDERKWKGYLQGDISTYAIIDCPEPNLPLLIFSIGMLNNSTLNEIAFFQCKIYRIGDNNRLVYISDNYYEVKNSNNTIGVVNNLDNGKYSIEIGFMMKDDLQNEYPTFYRKKCAIVK